MRFSFLIALLLFCTISTVAQGNHGSVEDEEKVQEVVGSLVADREKAHVLLRDLSEIEGYVVLLGYDDFQLGTKKRARAGQRIKYMDVLAIWGKGHSVSLIPDPKTPGHGRWDDLRKLPPNSLVEVVTAAGEARSGRFRSSDANRIVIADKDGSDEWTIQRADVVYVYRVRHDGRDISGGTTGGARKGEKIGRGVGQVAGGIRGPISGQSGGGNGGVGAAMGTGIGALIGAAAGSAGKTSTLRVLFYSR